MNEYVVTLYALVVSYLYESETSGSLCSRALYSSTGLAFVACPPGPFGTDTVCICRSATGVWRVQTAGSASNYESKIHFDRHAERQKQDGSWAGTSRYSLGKLVPLLTHMCTRALFPAAGSPARRECTENKQQRV